MIDIPFDTFWVAAPTLAVAYLIVASFLYGIFKKREGDETATFIAWMWPFMLIVLVALVPFWAASEAGKWFGDKIDDWWYS